MLKLREWRRRGCKAECSWSGLQCERDRRRRKAVACAACQPAACIPAGAALVASRAALVASMLRRVRAWRKTVGEPALCPCVKIGTCKA